MTTRPTDRSSLVAAVLGWQDRCGRGIEDAARAGGPAMIRLRDPGLARRVRAAYGRTADNGAQLRQAFE